MVRPPSRPEPQAATIPFSPDLTGPSEFRNIVTHKDATSEYELDDGTILRVRPTVIDVRKLTNQWAPDGDPVYVAKIGFAISTQAPAQLRKGGKLTEARKSSVPRKKPQKKAGR